MGNLRRLALDPTFWRASAAYCARALALCAACKSTAEFDLRDAGVEEPEGNKARLADGVSGNQQTEEKSETKRNAATQQKQQHKTEMNDEFRQRLENFRGVIQIVKLVIKDASNKAHFEEFPCLDPFSIDF